MICTPKGRDSGFDSWTSLCWRWLKKSFFNISPSLVFPRIGPRVRCPLYIFYNISVKLHILGNNMRVPLPIVITGLIRVILRSHRRPTCNCYSWANRMMSEISGVPLFQSIYLFSFLSVPVALFSPFLLYISLLYTITLVVPLVLTMLMTAMFHNFRILYLSICKYIVYYQNYEHKICNNIILSRSGREVFKIRMCLSKVSDTICTSYLKCLWVITNGLITITESYMIYNLHNLYIYFLQEQILSWLLRIW